MSEIIIKIESPELTQAINNLANAMGGNNHIPQNVSVPLPEPKSNSVPIAPMPVPTVPVQTVPVAPTAPLAVQQPSAPATIQAPTSVPSYSIEQFQTAIAPLLDAGKVSQVQQLVQSFGVSTLMEIPKERYSEFANGLRSIGGVL